MTEELFKLLDSSGMKTNELYRKTERFHFGEESNSECVHALDKYVTEQGGIYQCKLTIILDEYLQLKNNCILENKQADYIGTEAIAGILEFGETPMSGYFCHKFPDKSAYFLTELKNNKEEVEYDVMYSDADTNNSYCIGKLYVAVDKLKTEPKECKTRGNLGTKFWWVNCNNLVHYYLFSLQKHISMEANKYYQQCWTELNKHKRNKEYVFRSYEHEGGNSKVFS